MPSVTDLLVIMYGILLQRIFFVTAVVTVDNGIFYMAGVNIILLVNEIMNILPDRYIETVFLFG